MQEHVATPVPKVPMRRPEEIHLPPPRGPEAPQCHLPAPAQCHPPLGQAVAALRATPGATWADVRAAVKGWRKSVYELEDSWYWLVEDAANLLDYWKNKVTTEATTKATATAQAGDLQDESTSWETAGDNPVAAAQQPPVPPDKDKLDLMLDAHFARVDAAEKAMEEAMMATSQAGTATRRGQQVEVAVGLLGRLVVECDRADQLSLELHDQLDDMEAALEGKKEVPTDVPEALVVAVDKFQQLWEASSRQNKRHLLRRLEVIYHLLLSPYGSSGGPGGHSVAKRCQEAIEDTWRPSKKQRPVPSCSRTNNGSSITGTPQQPEAEIVDCTCRTRLKGIRCDTPPVKYRNWDSYVKRQQSRPRGPPEEYPCCREDGTPVARGNRVDGKGRGGYKNSPTIFGEQLAKDLESWEPPLGEGQLRQYVDDLLIATQTQETCVDCTEQGIALGILAQNLGPYQRAVAYLSKQLDTAAKGWPSGSTGEPVIHECLEAIEATYSSRQDLKDTPLEDAETCLLMEADPDPECCDKCLSKCLEFRLKIEGCVIRGSDIDFNITQGCTDFHENQTKITPPVPRKAVITQIPTIPEVEEQVTPVVSKIKP
ncbi:hypothetical protein DUI87_06222 [Hirundo rustica rustica]|uniref:Uncharacterized protein n=1 Tax=Hirundo rustica rustica TaxID=333673 RepID=A0A3M0LCX3_HIRRU|nr:hypothetical protein DUI87_06222 [Hirundo rustica rustica]